MKATRTIVLAGALALVSSAALASSYTVTPLGQTVPMWYEHAAGVNAAGYAAWTKTSGAAPTAVSKAYAWNGTAQVDLHALRGAQTPAVLSSYANAISEQSDIVGYGAINQRETQRQALLWTYNGTTWAAQNLPAVASGPAPVQTAAYAVTREAGDATRLLIGGYTREKVGAATLSKPLVWRGPAGALVASELSTDAGGYGIVYGVTSGGASHNWACGSYGTAAAAYSFATCWNLNSGARTLLTNGISGAGVASSVVRRVVTVNLGAADATFAVGTMLTSAGNSRGFIYKLNGPAAIPDVQWVDGLGGAGVAAMLMDVVETSLPAPGGTTHWGFTAVGMGATASTAGYGTLINAGTPGSAYHGISKTFLPNQGTASPVCDIQRETLTSDADATVAANLNGEKRLVWSGNQLSLYTENHILPKPEILVRNTTVTIRPGLFSKPAITQTPQHYQGRVTGISSKGRLRWSSAPGCETMAGTGMTDCNNAQSSIGTGVDTPIVMATGGRALTSVFPGAAPSTATYPYVQASLSPDSLGCDLSPVFASDAVVSMNPQADFNGEMRNWQNCDANTANGFETDIRRDYYHCGACNTPIVEDGKWCTLDQCVGGAVDRSILEANSCHISSGCYTGGTRSPATVCQRCTPGTSTTSWSNSPDGTACTERACYTSSTCTSGACGGGNAIRDGWDSPTTNDTADTARQLGGTAGRSFNEDDYWGSRNTQSSLTTFPTGDVDWYWFWADDCWQDGWLSWSCGGTNSGTWDQSGADEQPQPRVRVIPAAGVDLDFCMYIQCANGSGASGFSNFRGTNTANANTIGHAHPNGHTGFCSQASAGQPEDLELHWDCGGTNETAKVWIKVFEYQNAGNATCSTPYTLEWGNDKG